MSSSNNIKRRKTTPSSLVRKDPFLPLNECSVQNLALLPIDQICSIANFLPKTSRALFAVALTAPPKSFRNRVYLGGYDKILLAPYANFYY